MFEKIKEKINPKKVTTWYGKYERPISSLSLVGGFVFDAITLKRVDMFWENFWILGHLFIIAVCIILTHSLQNDPGDEADPEKWHFWLVNILQFFFGGLISVFLVFYFRSAELSASWPFILVLAVAFWANEKLKRQFIRLTFQLSLFFLSIFCCLIYIVPIVLHKIGDGPFLISGALSLAFMLLFLHVLVRFSREKFYNSRRAVSVSIVAIFLSVNILYFTNLIPPLPISLKDSGVYHSITKNNSGNYTASYEDSGWRSYLQIYKNYHYTQGDTVYAYSAIFSPSSLDVTVIHEWQKYNQATNSWETLDTFRLPVLGGRDGGFRTYSQKNGLSSGKWRVNVETLSGQVIGRLRFEIIPTTKSPTLKTKTLH